MSKKEKLIKNISYYLNLPYELIIKKLNIDDGGYIAYYKDFPYIIGDGDNEINAINDAKNAFKSALEIMLSKGDIIKEPKTKEPKTRINITIDKALLVKIDKISKNRSAFLAQSALKALD